MRYQSLTLLAITIASVAASPTQNSKRDFVTDAKGNLKLTCKLKYAQQRH